MLRSLVILTLVVSACGVEDQAAPDAASTAVVPSPTSEVASSAREGDARLVASADRLPTCNEDSEGTLAYVITDKAFVVCSSGAWISIDLAGEDGPKGEHGEDGEAGAKGDTGAQGEAGAKGDTGAKGETGEDGATGATGPAGQDANSNSWLDPITDKRWIRATNGDYATAILACTGTYALPEGAEMMQAALHGIATGLPGVTAAWVLTDNPGSSGLQVSGIGVVPLDGGRPKTDVIGIYCVKQGG